MARPKKVDHFKIQPFKNTAGTQSWRVTGSKADGTRVRKNFSERADAIQEMADLEAEFGGVTVAPKVQRTRLSAEEISDAEAAIRHVGGRKLALLVSHYLALESRSKAKGISLDLAVAFAESHYRSETKSISVLNAYNEFIQNKPFGSKKTKEHYENCLARLLVPDPNKNVHTFTVADIEKILSKYKNLNSRDTYRRAISAFFNWSVRHHYCLENPCGRLDRIPKDMSQITILSLDEVRRLLFAAATYQKGVMAATIAIGIFAGLRPSEIEHLKPEQILQDGIRVTGGKLRRNLNRTAPIPPVLGAWLSKFPFTGIPKGLKYRMKQLKKATKATKWVQDVIRHTSISFQTERDKNEALTAYNNGTTNKMMDLHYRSTIGNSALLTEFWSLTPAKLLANKPGIELPGKPKIMWPSIAALKKLVWGKPLVHAAKEVGVSDVALRKHCVKLGIELPKQGHWIRQQQLAARR
jgi:integrase